MKTDALALMGEMLATPSALSRYLNAGAVIFQRSRYRDLCNAFEEFAD